MNVLDPSTSWGDIDGDTYIDMSSSWTNWGGGAGPPTSIPVLSISCGDIGPLYPYIDAINSSLTWKSWGGTPYPSMKCGNY